MNGLISFPSYHAATALLYIWAAWRTPVLKWIVLLLNIAMLLATPLHGSHYFVDVIAGAVVAFITIRITQWAFARLRETRHIPVVTPWLTPIADDRKRV
jgi:membrane-associated phospholipid phosphatase